MTPNALRELAAEMRSIMCDDEMSRGEIYRWAAKLESLAGECAVVPREPTAHMVTVGRQELGLSMDTCDFAVCARYTYRAMIKAAERQEAGR